MCVLNGPRAHALPTQDEKADSGIVIPLLPFGIKKYDEGERFDLRR